MQKRPNMPIVFDAVALNADWPVRIIASDRQDDRPIDFLHAHSLPELGYCYEGAGIFMIDNRMIPYQAGDVSLIDARQLHLAQSLPNSCSRWDWIYVDLPKLFCRLTRQTALSNFHFCWRADFPGILPASRYPAISRRLRRIAVGMQEEHRYRREKTVAEFCLLMIDLQALFPSSPETPSRQISPELLERLSPALHYLNGHYHENFQVSDLARLCNLSETHFRRLFRRFTGASPLGYQRQLQLAGILAQLADRNRSIGEIAFGSGFNSLSSFNRLFKAAVGCSPREWRQRNACDVNYCL